MQRHRNGLLKPRKLSAQRSRRAYPDPKREWSTEAYIKEFERLNGLKGESK